MAVVRSVFLNDQQARIALDRLRAIFTDDRINMRSFPSPKNEPLGSGGDYDPIGSARLAGTAVSTLPATGANLVGNSTTLDLSIGEFDDIVAMVAEGERRNQYRRSSMRIVATVDVLTEDEAEKARYIMTECGGRDLSLDKRDLAYDDLGEPIGVQPKNDTELVDLDSDHKGDTQILDVSQTNANVMSVDPDDNHDAEH
jgi:hypothetical protein